MSIAVTDMNCFDDHELNLRDSPPLEVADDDTFAVEIEHFERVVTVVVVVADDAELAASCYAPEHRSPQLEGVLDFL